MIENTPDGHLGICETCGDRDVRFRGYGEAQAWCDQHERKSAGGLLNAGSRPSLRTLWKNYSDRSQMMVYTPEERAQWRALADDLWERIRATDKNTIIEGQMTLFESATE